MQVTVTIENDRIETDTNDTELLLAALAGIEQRIIDLDGRKGYDEIAIVTTGMMFDESESLEEEL